MPFDDDKWKEIVSQWESDNPAAADADTPPNTDAADLAKPEAWAGASEPDADEAGGPSDGDADNAMVLPEMDFSAPTRVDTSPATVGAGQKGGRLPVSPAEPTASPKPPPPESLDWKGLSDRLQRAEAAKGTAQGYETMFANIGAQSGYRPNVHAGEEGVAMAKAPIEAAQAKQTFERGQLGNQKLKADMGVKAAMDDPNSLQSQKAREAVRAMGVQLPKGFDNYSASDIHNFVKTGELATMERARAADADRDAKALAAKTAAEQKAAQTTKDLEGSRKAYSGELKKLGIDPTTASQKDIDRAISLAHAKATEAVATSNNRIAQAAEGRKANEEEQLKQGIPFGNTELRYAGHGTPRADDVNEAQKVAALYGAAIDGMDDLQTKIDTFAKSPGPATKDAVASAARIVGGHLNTAFGQGAMSKDEAEAMSQVLGSDMRSAAGVQALIDKLTGDDPAAAQALTRKLKAARESTNASALGKLKTYRFAPSGGSSTGTVKMKFPDGSVHDVSPEKLDRARAKGGVPVDG